MRYISAATLAFVLGFSTSANAMDFTLQPVDAGSLVLMDGEVKNGDAVRFARLLKQVPTSRPTMFLLNSNGGNLFEAEKMGSLIEDFSGKAITGVSDGDTCSSSCVLIFLATKYRMAHPNASIGVHSPSIGGKEDAVTATANIIVARTFSKLGVPASVIGKMVTTLPDKIYWLTKDDLVAMGVDFFKPQAATAAAPTAPKETNDKEQNETSPMFERGLADREAMEQWVEQFSGEYRAGIDYWASQGSTPNPGPCTGSLLFVQGCQQAKAKFAPLDRLRKMNAEYKEGWNSY